MKALAAIVSAIMVAALLAACTPPSKNAYGNRDARNTKPFWQLNDQRDD